MLDRFMAKIGLDGARIDAVVGQLESTGVPVAAAISRALARSPWTPMRGMAAWVDITILVSCVRLAFNAMWLVFFPILVGVKLL
jgi:hypothetical protein